MVLDVSPLASISCASCVFILSMYHCPLQHAWYRCYLGDPWCHTCNIILPSVQRIFPLYQVHSQWLNDLHSLRMCNFCCNHLIASFTYHDKLDCTCGWTKYLHILDVDLVGILLAWGKVFCHLLDE